MLITGLYRCTLAVVVFGSLLNTTLYSAETLVFEPKGESAGKHIVLVSGDEEYRTEETMPMLGKWQIVSKRSSRLQPATASAGETSVIG